MSRLSTIAIALFAYAALTGAGAYKWVDENGVTHYSDAPVSGKGVEEIPLDPEIPPEQTQAAQENLRLRLEALEARSQQDAAERRARQEAQQQIAAQRRLEQEAKAQAAAAQQQQVYPGYGWGGVVVGPGAQPWLPWRNPRFPPPGQIPNQPSPCSNSPGGSLPPCTAPLPQPMHQAGPPPTPPVAPQPMHQAGPGRR
jgi:hypothetical protein